MGLPFGVPRDTLSNMKMNRRRVLGLLGAGALVPGADAAEGALRFAGLDHVEFTVSDVEKSLAFYVRVFGNTVMKNNQTTRRYIKLGGCYIALDKTQWRQVQGEHGAAFWRSA
jgi:catechol-2,3-dioxygenase